MTGRGCNLGDPSSAAHSRPRREAVCTLIPRQRYDAVLRRALFDTFGNRHRARTHCSNEIVQ